MISAGRSHVVSRPTIRSGKFLPKLSFYFAKLIDFDIVEVKMVNVLTKQAPESSEDAVAGINALRRTSLDPINSSRTGP